MLCLILSDYLHKPDLAKDRIDMKVKQKRKILKILAKPINDAATVQRPLSKSMVNSILEIQMKKKRK